MVAEHITNLPCTKHSGKRVHTQMLVVHSIESPLANGYAVSMAQNWLGKWYKADGSLIEASSNVIVSPDTLVRSVHTDYAAWHASWANSLSVGYEQAGYAAFTRAQWLTDLGKNQIDRLAREMALDAKLYGIPLVWLTRAQVDAIAAGNRTIKGLVTHAVIDPFNRTDPGNAYPYDVLLASIRKYAGQASTPTPKPLIEKEASEMPKYKRVGPGKVPTQLGKGSTWYLKHKAGKVNENYAVNGFGHYLADLFVQGEGLPAGETLTVRFVIIPTGGKASSYFEQEIHGSADGTFRGTARFNMPILKATRLEVSVTATSAAKLTHYAADVTTWEK